MAENIITPLRLWQDFDPMREKLDVSFVASESVGEDIVRFGCYFTSEKTHDGVVRAYATIYFSPHNVQNPTLLFVPDYYAKTIDFSFLRTTIGDGYNIVIIDYTGKEEENNYTHYPPSLSYCNIVESGSHLYKAIPTARDTCLYNWSKVVRRCITLVEDLEFLNSDIALIGIKEGANMMWQVGGVDDRVKTLIPVINAGWLGDTDKIGEDGYELDDERERWIAACTPEVYAQFAHCPVFFLGASNSTITAFDRVRDTFDLLVGVEHNMVIASDSANQIQMTGLITLERWMDHVFKGTSFPEQPVLRYEVREGKLEIYIESDGTIDLQEIVLNYSYGNTDSEFRFWNKKMLSVDFSGRSYTTLDVYDGDEVITVFANVYYKDGSSVSSDSMNIYLEDEEVDTIKYRNERILFERKHGVRNFIIENDGFIADKSLLKMEAGPYDIQGITVEDGFISTYIVGDKRYKGLDGTLLQCDLYSAEARDVEVILYTMDDETDEKDSYSALVHLEGGEMWQKVALVAHDFTNKRHQHLLGWQNIKKLTIKNSAKVLLSNMVWV